MLSEGKIVDEDFRRLHVTDSPEQIVKIVSDSKSAIDKMS